MTRPLLLALTFTFLVTADAPAQVKLAWKLNKGDRLFVEEIVNARQTTVLSGNTTRQQLDLTRIIRYTVLASDERGMTLEMKIERIKAGPPQAEAKVLAVLEGAAFQIVVDANGNALKLQGYDELVTRIAREDADSARLLRSAVTADSLKALTETLFAFTPAHEVKKGDRWNRTARIGLGALGTMTAKNAYTVQGEDDSDRNLWKIGVVSQFAHVLPAKDKASPFTVTEGLIRSDGADGTLWFHPKLGRLVRAESRRTLRGTLSVSTSDGVEKMELTQHQTSKIRVLETSSSLQSGS